MGIYRVIYSYRIISVSPFKVDFSGGEAAGGIFTDIRIRSDIGFICPFLYKYRNGYRHCAGNRDTITIF